MDNNEFFPNTNENNSRLNAKLPKSEAFQKKKANEIQMDQTKLRHHYLIKIGPNNIPVYFPYEPYDIQIAYMEKVIDALENKQNALLQSPTGTGKTLCLLCASLGWLNYRREIERYEKKLPIRILYSSRTHSQLKQVMKELKSTAYKPFCTIIGSRDHYCIKQEFMNLKGANLNASCAKARKMKTKAFHQMGSMADDGVDMSCKYYQLENELMNYTIPKLFNPNSIKGSELKDIEDLKFDGKINKYCPYYVSMKIVNDVDILFLPYNYLLEKKLRSILKLSLENTAVIFDEAHNIEQIAEEGSSYELSLQKLTSAISEVEELEELHRKVSSVIKVDEKKNKYTMDLPEALRTMPEDCQLLIAPIKNFKQKLMKILSNESSYNVKHYSKEERGVILENKDIFSFIENCSQGVEQNNFQKDPKKNPFASGWNLSNLKDYLQILQKALEDLNLSSIFGLDSLFLFLDEIFNLWTNNSMLECKGAHEWDHKRINHYKLYLRNNPEDPTDVLMYLWCFTPSLSFHDIMSASVRNLILTSGTLAPFKSFESETKIEYPIVLANPHIVNTKENLLAGVFQRGPQSNVFNFCYSNRDKEELFIDMGETFINLARQIPNGILMIFASYLLLEKTYSIWSKSDVLRRLEEIKPITKEPKNSGVLTARMAQFIKNARSPKGGILMAVCRGKISEGIDFSDELARAVFLIGIPFPPLYDRRVELKQKYLDIVLNNRIETRRRISGKEWYMLQAIRAMNQAIGRIIRHKNDYGCILFFDIRFNNSEVKREISGWVREEMKVYENFGHGYKEVMEFFKRKRQPTNFNQIYHMINKGGNSADSNPNAQILEKTPKVFHDEELHRNNSSSEQNPFMNSTHELKKINKEGENGNFILANDPMEELMALNFDNKSKSKSFPLKINETNNASNVSKGKGIAFFDNYEYKTKQEVISSDSENIQPSIKSSIESINMKNNEYDKKKSITVQDLKKLSKRDDLRNCTLTLKSIEELETFKDFLNQRENFECMICYMNKTELYSSKCGHLACLDCWKRWLQEKLNCPKCKARVREKTLIRVFNN